MDASSRTQPTSLIESNVELFVCYRGLRIAGRTEITILQEFLYPASKYKKESTNKSGSPSGAQLCKEILDFNNDSGSPNAGFSIPIAIGMSVSAKPDTLAVKIFTVRTV